jgi:hypothetical protein
MEIILEILAAAFLTNWKEVKQLFIKKKLPAPTGNF